MSKLHKLKLELAWLEEQGFIVIDDNTMRIEREYDFVADQILQTGPWGALLLLGRLPEALQEIRGK